MHEVFLAMMAMPALALEIHRIHHALAHLFVIAKVRIDGAWRSPEWSCRDLRGQ